MVFEELKKLNYGLSSKKYQNFTLLAHFLMRSAISYHLYNTHGGVLLLVKLEAKSLQLF